MTMLKLLLAATTLGVVADAGAAAPQGRAPGYALGQPTLARAPYSMADLAALQKSMLFGADDVAALRQSRAILAVQTEAILDVWYGFAASTPEVVVFFGDTRILGTADAKYDQAWLDWQYEIGLRHNRLTKNKTDGAHGPAQVDFRNLPALTIPITTTRKPFLAKKGASAADVEKMRAAWVKVVLLQAILWSHPYVKDGEF